MSLTDLLARPVHEVAPELLGCQISANGVTIRLVEVEAYAGVGEDPASHAHRGLTVRNTPMFGEPGTLYVYFTYGMHWCANIVCGPAGYASAVLLRAGEVTGGIEIARSRRGTATDRDLARGPARLASALGLDKAADGTSVLNGRGPLVLAPPEMPIDPLTIHSGPRVGIRLAAEVPWRFWLSGDRYVSPHRSSTRAGSS